jgi:hypothetical protein
MGAGRKTLLSWSDDQAAKLQNWLAADMVWPPGQFICPFLIMWMVSIRGPLVFNAITGALCLVQVLVCSQFDRGKRCCATGCAHLGSVANSAQA